MAEPGLPDGFVARMRQLLGPEAPDFIDSYRRPAQRAVRANPLKLEPAGLPALLGLEPDPVPWYPEAFFLPQGVRLGASPATAAGLCYLQEPSALAGGGALDLRQGQRVLDLAAAPGGKTTLVAAIREEFRRTRALVVETTGAGRLLGHRPVLRQAVELRNPYVDALSFLQVRFLTELRNGLAGGEAARAAGLVLLTVNGVAAGLQNTG